MSATTPDGHNRYWLASLESDNASADLRHPPGNFVTQGERRGRVEKFGLGTVHDADVGVTKPTAADLNEKLASTGRRFGHLLKLRWLLGFNQAIGDHRFISSIVTWLPRFDPFLVGVDHCAVLFHAFRRQSL